MVRVVLAAQVVHVARRDERAAQLLGCPHDPLVGLVLLRHAVRLDLEVDVLGAEDPDQVVDVLAGVAGALGDQPLAEARLEAAREHDHAGRVPVEELRVNGRLAAAKAVEKAARGELHEVAEALVAGRKQGQVVALPPALGAAVVDQIGLEPQDRLDPVVAARLVVLDRPVHDPVVGQAERRHAQLCRPGGQLVDLAGAVQQRVLAVHVQVNRPGLRHRLIMSIDPDATGPGSGK